MGGHLFPPTNDQLSTEVDPDGANAIVTELHVDRIINEQNSR